MNPFKTVKNDIIKFECLPPPRYSVYYTAVRRYELYFRVVKTYQFYERAQRVNKILFLSTRK